MFFYYFSDSFWKPYIDILPEKYPTILYYTSDELAELRVITSLINESYCFNYYLSFNIIHILQPSPTFESSLKLYRSIARQYAYFYIKIHTLGIPVLKNLQDIFTFENYR